MRLGLSLALSPDHFNHVSYKKGLESVIQYELE